MNKILKVIFLVAIAFAGIPQVFSQNPIIQTKFTADPAPLVHHDTVFLYTSHDEDDAFGFKMKEWLLYTSTDMVNWTDHGAVASLEDFKWVNTDNGAWAPQCIERNGKFYLYCPVPNGLGIGVLVADNPYGPFKDPIGKPLVQNSPEDIDPTVFIDDDGQAYMYWGNPNLWYVKLNEDMISIAGDVVKDASFAKTEGQPDPFHYQEGPWAWKHNGNYYMAYASTCCPEGIGYAMSKSASGPWEYKGMIMDGDSRSSGNHPGIIPFKGKWYVFGFNFVLSQQIATRHSERRSVCVTELKYNSDGTLQKLPFWFDTVNEQIGTFNPFRRVEAETIAYSEGVKTSQATEWENDSPWNRGGKIADRFFVTSINNGDYTMVKGVNFSKTASEIELSAAAINGGKIELRIDSLHGPMIGTLAITRSGESDLWRTYSASLKNTSGVHDLYFVFHGEKDLFNFDWWKFND